MKLGILISILFADVNYVQPDGVNAEENDGVTLNDRRDVLDHYQLNPKLPLSSMYSTPFANPYAEAIRKNSNIKEIDENAWRPH